VLRLRALAAVSDERCTQARLSRIFLSSLPLEILSKVFERSLLSHVLSGCSDPRSGTSRPLAGPLFP
jgi:hypothetical protein